MIKFNLFRQRVLPLNANQIRQPRAVDAEQWHFPHGTFLHHFDTAPIHASAPYLKNETAITVYPVKDIELNYLSGRKLSTALDTSVNAYLQKLERPLVRGRNLIRDVISLSTLPVRDYHFLRQSVVYQNADDETGSVKNQYFAEMNEVDTLIRTLLRESEAESDSIVVGAPVELFKASNLRRYRGEPPIKEMEAWGSKAGLFLREVFMSIDDKDHILHGLKRPLFLSIIKDGHLFTLDVTQMLTWAEGNERATETNFALFVSKAQESKNGVTVGDDLDNTTEEVEETPISLDTVSTTTEHGDEVTQKVVRLGNESDSGIVKAVRAQQVGKGLTAAETKRLEKLSERYKTIPAPEGDGTLVDQIKTAKGKVVGRLYEPTLTRRDAIQDESMYSASTLEKNRKYINNGVMEADIADTVLALSNLGYMVQDYSYEDKGDALNHFREYTVKVVPVDGMPTTFKFKIHKVKEDGSFTANGTRYRLVPQKADMPIRKVGPARVALTADMGKVNVTRSAYAAYNLESWWSKKVMLALTSDEAIKNVRMTAGKHEKVYRSRTVSAIGQSAASFSVRGIKFVFDSKQAKALVGEKLYEEALKHKLTIVAEKDGKRYAINELGELIESDGKAQKNLGPFAEWIDPTWTKLPSEFVEVSVRGKKIPLALYLGYVIAMSHDISEIGRDLRIQSGSQGLQSLLDILKVKHRWANKGTRAEPNEKIVRFEGETLYYDGRDQVASLILSGLGRMEKATRYISPADLNAGGTYVEMLDFLGHPSNLTTTIGLMQDGFIDPITRELLEGMGEPDEMVPLLLRATAMLLDDAHQDETDRRYMRDRGYERVAGFLHRELLEAVRIHRSSPYPSRSGISIPPNSITDAMVQDQSVRLVEESNPAHTMKEIDSLTYTGVGGRTGRTMTEETRRFLPSDIGAMSEAVPDSNKVGVNAYAPQGALYNSLRGTVDTFDPKIHGANNVVSSSSMLLPGSANTDPKRNNLAGIQLSSMVSCVGGSLLPARTGYEMTVHERQDGTFGYPAADNGRVTKITDHAITVAYENGTEVSYFLGLKHGNAAGAVLPHTLVTDLKEKDKVKKGDAVTWCSNYFSRDILNPGGVSMKGGYLTTTLFKDDKDTLEDGSTISTAASKQMSTPVTKKITKLVAFTDNVRDLVKVGQHVEADDPIMVIEDSVVAGMASMDDALLGIDKLSNKFPRAEEAGTVTNIEVLYQGKIEDMSETLAELAKADNSRRRKLSKLKDANPSVTGEIAETAFFNKEKIVPNTMAITFYIDHYIDAEIGDKAVINNPLKTIYGVVHSDRNRTESGRPIEIKFAFQSVDNRIVYSPIRYGILDTTLDAITSLVVDAYDS